MGQFSLIHWIIVLLILVPTIALTIVPSWRIARKAGFSGAWSLLLLVPGLNVLMIWAFAFTRWPNDSNGKDRTSVAAMSVSVLLLAMLVLGIVLMPMLEKKVARTAQQDMQAPQPTTHQAQPPQQSDWERGTLSAPSKESKDPMRPPANFDFDPSTARKVN